MPLFGNLISPENNALACDSQELSRGEKSNSEADFSSGCLPFLEPVLYCFPVQSNLQLAYTMVERIETQ